jgi:hypothetical protein
MVRGSTLSWPFSTLIYPYSISAFISRPLMETFKEGYDLSILEAVVALRGVNVSELGSILWL